MDAFHRPLAIGKRLTKRHSRITSWTVIILLFGLFWAISWQTLDPDFGWHLAAGNYIWQHWVPAHDIFTYSARGYRWIDHEWGNDIIVSVLFQLGGYGLASAVFAGLWTAVICLFRRRFSLGILLFATIAILPYAGIRPTVWTVLCLALLLELANRASSRTLALIPPLMLLWANLHGGFIIGLAIICYFYLRSRRTMWLIVLSASTVASLINPYGPRLYVEVAHTLFDPAVHSQVSEWQSFFLLPSGWLFMGIWFAAFVAYDRRKLGNWFGVTPLLALASLSASRNLPLFVISSLWDFDRYRGYFKLPKRIDLPQKILISTGVILTLTIAFYSLYVSYLPWQSRDATYPMQEVAYLQKHQCSGNLFNDYAYGGFLIWKLPSSPVYIDGRMPTWHDRNGRSYINRYESILHAGSDQRNEFSHYNIRCAVLARSGADKKLQTTLLSEGWKIVSTGNGAVLLELK